MSAHSLDLSLAFVIFAPAFATLAPHWLVVVSFMVKRGYALKGSGTTRINSLSIRLAHAWRLGRHKSIFASGREAVGSCATLELGGLRLGLLGSGADDFAVGAAASRRHIGLGSAARAFASALPSKWPEGHYCGWVYLRVVVASALRCRQANALICRCSVYVVAVFGFAAWSI